MDGHGWIVKIPHGRLWLDRGLKEAACTTRISFCPDRLRALNYCDMPVFAMKQWGATKGESCRSENCLNPSQDRMKLFVTFKGWKLKLFVFLLLQHG